MWSGDIKLAFVILEMYYVYKKYIDCVHVCVIVAKLVPW